MRPTDRRRRGFTLVELLVAAALALVVMTVLSLAFQTGLQTLSQLKSVVGLAEQLRSAESVFRADLGAAHLEADDGRTVRLPQAGGHSRGFFAFTQGGMAQTSGGPVGYGPFAEFLRANENGVQSFRTQSALQPAPQAGTTLTYPEPTATVGQLFGRAWMDTLHLTVRQNGDRPQAVFTAPAGPLLGKLRNLDPGFAALPVEVRSADPLGTQLTSRWAEVTYFLMPAGPPGGTTPSVFTADEGGVTQLPLYTLYRRQRVLADRSVTSPTPSADPNFFSQPDAQAARGLAMAVVNPASPTGPWVVLGPEAVARNAANRLGGDNDKIAPGIPGSVAPGGPLFADLQRRGYPIPAGSTDTGADLLASNVLSMTVRPVYEFDVSANVLSQLSTIQSSGVNIAPKPKSLLAAGQLPSYVPLDWLELQNVRADMTYTTTNTPARASLAGMPANPGFPRYFDTAGPSKVGVVFRNAATNAPLSVDWDQQDPNNFEVKATLKAIEVKLRVYDAKNKTSRQMTVLQDL